MYMCYLSETDVNKTPELNLQICLQTGVQEARNCDNLHLDLYWPKWRGAVC
jgi:hypothetical protein